MQGNRRGPGSVLSRSPLFREQAESALRNRFVVVERRTVSVILKEAPLGRFACSETGAD
jgi:hypothetical protein